MYFIGKNHLQCLKLADNLSNIVEYTNGYAEIMLNLPEIEGK